MVADPISWWSGMAYKRTSPAYQSLLDRAYDALAQNHDFVTALLSTGLEPLTHSIGLLQEDTTVVTEKEFVSRLYRIRTRLQLAIIL